MWQVFLTLSVITVVASFLYILIHRRDKKAKVSPVNVILIAVFVANTLMFVPVYYTAFNIDTGFSLIFKTILVSLHHAIRLFIVDSDFEVIKDIAPSADTFLYNAYTSFAAILFVLSPAMTFGFIFSFFKNISAHRRYFANYNKNVYIFSEFNERSIELASSIKAKFHNVAIVFTNFDEDSMDSHKLQERARSFDAILFNKDILALNFNHHSPKRDINFLILGKDEDRNIKYALGIIEKYNNRRNTQLYVLSNEVEGELLLNAAHPEEIKVRRISNIRSMIYNILQFNGENLFKDALPNTSSSEKDISAVVVGLGKYGGEMTRSLAWFCQMEGYRVEIDAFDIDKCAEETFVSSCPELMDQEHNGKFDDPGESRYKISVHSSIDVDSITFDKEIRSLTKTTYVFVSLGDDEKNIRTSIKLRMLFEQIGIKPRIHAVVESSDRKKALEGITNYSGQAYDVEYVGATNEMYSYDNIINSDLEREALNRHLCWGEEPEFWKFEYNYRSSMASALHKRMKKACGIPGISKKPSERTEEEKQALRLMEHRRWNAYMRSQGYVYNEKRNNLAKTHHCLVTFDLLSQKDKEKDDD